MRKVSAIITTHNRAELLKRAIESVFSQTYEHIECIVVDDNSQDNTREVCERFPLQYIYIPKEESHGGNYARNKGINASTGDYCAFLDDDDYWKPTKIEKQVRLIEEKKCELVYCGKRNEIVSKKGVSYKDDLPNSKNQGDMSKRILQTICTTTTDILVSRNALIDVGLFDENLKFWQEYELSIRLAQRKPFYFVNEPLSVYRIDVGDKQRLTNKYYEWRDAVKYIHSKHKELYKKLNLVEKYKVMNLVWWDATKRCKACRLWGHYWFYKFLSAPYRVVVKLGYEW